MRDFLLPEGSRGFLRGAFAACALGILGLCAPASAEIGAIDQVPAATLLLPYFEAELGDSYGVTTIFTVINASASTATAHVTLWTDYAVPTLAVDISLAPYAAQPVNLRTLVTGTGPAGEDLSDRAAWVMAAHTGQELPEQTGYCAGRDYGDNTARGYVLIDVVNTAGAGYPGDPGYFVFGGLGVASNDNILWGDYLLIDQQNNFSFGDPLVSIEASSVNPVTSTPGTYTFYGALVSGSAADNREALGRAWGVPFKHPYPYPDARVIYWRDVQAVGTPVQCWSGPAWFPLSLTSATLFGDVENSESPTLSYGSFGLACGAETLGFSIPTSFPQGWADMDFNFTGSAAFGLLDQSYMILYQQQEGRFATGHTATLLQHVAEP